MKTLHIHFCLLASLLGFAAVRAFAVDVTAEEAAKPAEVEKKSAGPSSADRPSSISADAIRSHLEFLADDLLEGRGTGTRGEMLAVRYLETQCRALGLRPAGDAGSFRQRVGLVHTEVMPTQTTMELRAPDGVRRLSFPEDFVVLDTHRETEGRMSGDLVFVGYGISAPELNYDDYAGLDVRGKIVVALAVEGPPSLPPAVRAFCSKGDGVRANAAARGAIGLVLLRSPALEKRFPWPFLLRELEIGFNSIRWLQANGRPAGLDDTLRINVALNRAGAEALFAGESVGLDEMFARSAQGKPPRMALRQSAAVEFRSRHRPLAGHNVVAVLEGSDPLLRQEYVVLSSHHDHLGIGRSIDGDAIYNGAYDNAAGCAVLLEIARHFAANPVRPRRSLLFLWLTGEEAGMLGSDYFAAHPTVPRERIVANLNFDGPVAPVAIGDVIGYGVEHSSLANEVRSAAARTGFALTPDPVPEEGMFARTDQISFVKHGIPGVFLDLGIKAVDPGVDVPALRSTWRTTVYHSPKDDVTQPIHYPSSVRFAQFLSEAARAVADAPARPRWNDGDFFGRRMADRGP